MTDPIADAFDQAFAKRAKAEADLFGIPESETVAEAEPVDPGPPGVPRNPGAVGAGDNIRSKDPITAALERLGL